MKKFSEMKFVKPNILKLKEQMQNYTAQFKIANSFEEQDAILRKVFKLRDKYETNSTIAYIRYTIDTRDKKYAKAQEYLDENGPLLQAAYSEFDKALVNAKFKEQLEKKWGKYLFEMVETSLECFDEKIIPELQEINKLGSEYSKVIASAEIEFKGQKLNLSQLGKYSQDTDRKTRKEASLLSAKFFEDNNDKIGDIYDRMVKLRHQMAVKLGFKNYVELGYKMLGRTDYNETMVASYRQQIYEDLVPFANSLFKRQAKRIKIKNPQYYDYNLTFLSGNAKPLGNKDELVNKAQVMYHELSKETDEFFSYMVTYEMMDLEAKPGKVGGGYMTYLPDYKTPFIFSNFNGTSGDVDVLTHEFGHAFQGHMSRNIKCPYYRSPTLEACEIHSMSMEFFAYPWMNLFFDQEEKYRYAHLSSAITFIPYGATIDEFQHWVYENPEATHEMRCKKFREIEKKYLPHRRYDEVPIYENGGWWMKQSHVFQSPFYYIDYTLAQVVAFQFHVENTKNHEKAWKKYVKLCKLGGKYPFIELLEHAKLRNPFEDGTIKKIVSPLKKYLKTIDDSKY